jgi:glycerol kinase
MAEQFILALDQGTTSSRAIVFDRAGRVVATAQREFRQIYPRPGWVEHDPEEIWSSQHAVIGEVLDKAGAGPARVAAIGIANQRETTVLWDRATGRPLANAIVWQDRRTAGLCEQLRAAGCEPMVTGRTGLRLDPYFSGTKLRWLLDETPGARALAAAGRLAFGTIDSWLIWQLSGGAVHATDVSNASRTLLFNLRTRDWDDELLGLLEIPRGVLPEVRDSSGVLCRTADGIPVAGVAGDQQSALFGQGCHRPGLAKNTYGTGCFLLMNTGMEPVVSRHNLLATVAWRIGGATTYALEGSVFVAGALVQWLRDELGIIASAAEVEQVARTVPDSGGLVLVPAFTGLGAPHWDPRARGLAIGLTRGVNRAHFCRAALEAIAHQSADMLDAMAGDLGRPAAGLRVDGGATRNDLLMQLQADLAGVPVWRPANVESTAFGAAALAGLAVGFWAGPDELPLGGRGDAVFEPRLAPAEIARMRRAWRRAVARAGGWAED